MLEAAGRIMSKVRTIAAASYKKSIGRPWIYPRYDLPYVAGPLPVQYFKAWRTIAKMSLPDHMLRRTADDAPETHSERMFADLPKPLPAQEEGQRAGLQTALKYSEKRRARKVASAA